LFRWTAFYRTNKRQVLLASLTVAVVVFNLGTGDTLSDTVTGLSLVLLLYTQAILPHNLIEQAKRATSHGIPIPRSIGEMSSWLDTAFKPTGGATALCFALLGYAWVAPSDQFVSLMKPFFAVLANVCLVLSFSSYIWGRLLKNIQEERYDSTLYGGWALLFPLIAVSAGTSYISIISGVMHWEDSIAFYGPAIALSLVVAHAIPKQGMIPPKSAEDEMAALNAERSKLVERLGWTRDQKDAYQPNEYRVEVDRLERSIADINKKRTRYDNALKEYAKVVDKVIAEISEYLTRRALRERIVSSGEALAAPASAELGKATDRSLEFVSKKTTREPRSCLEGRKFDATRQTVTVLNFSLILQGFGEYPPLVSKLEAKPLSKELDRSTYASLGPATIRYAIRKYEVAEVAWMWGVQMTLSAAANVLSFLRDYKASAESYQREVRSRINAFETITRMDPKSEYATIMDSVRNGKSGLAAKLNDSTANVEAAKKACADLERFSSVLDPVLRGQDQKDKIGA
jgi:hypothetical protein